MSSESMNIRDRIKHKDVTVMRSYLEVDVAEWFGDEEVPFAYEPFVIPSVVGPSKDEWDTMVEAVRAVGKGDEGKFDDIVDGTKYDEFSAFEVRTMWGNIFAKHRLVSEKVDILEQDALAKFDKELLLPDFVLYKDFDGQVVGDDFDWSSYDYIIEVSGLWGVGLPGEPDESDWWDWYRVGGVAFKEFMYKLLGLWEDVYWAIPVSGPSGEEGGMPRQLREDEHYVMMNPTQSDLGLDELGIKIGVSTDNLDSKLSPAIRAVEYERPKQGVGDISRVEYEWDGIDVSNIDNVKEAVHLGGDVIMYYGGYGDLYVTPDSAHVRESQWRNENMLFLREYVADGVSTLYDGGIVEGYGRV